MLCACVLKRFVRSDNAVNNDSSDHRLSRTRKIVAIIRRRWNDIVTRNIVGEILRVK